MVGDKNLMGSANYIQSDPSCKEMYRGDTQSKFHPAKDDEYF